MAKKQRLPTTVRGKKHACPFCGDEVYIGPAAVVHAQPICEKFGTMDAAEFVKAARKPRILQ